MQVKHRLTSKKPSTYQVCPSNVTCKFIIPRVFTWDAHHYNQQSGAQSILGGHLEFPTPLDISSFLMTTVVHTYSQVGFPPPLVHHFTPKNGFKNGIFLC